MTDERIRKYKNSVRTLEVLIKTGTIIVDIINVINLKIGCGSAVAGPLNICPLTCAYLFFHTKHAFSKVDQVTLIDR